MSYMCKESYKPEGESNFKAYKKRNDLVLRENDVMKFVQGKALVPNKGNAQ